MNRELINIPKPQPRAKFRLFCFPYAGGSAHTYINWGDFLSRDVEIAFIQPPGRGIRLLEKPFETMEEYIDALHSNFLKLSKKNYFFFGHSMGARVAFELILSLRKNRLPLPLHFFASGSPAPCFQRKEEGIHHLPEPAFIKKLGDLQGSPPEVLENSELMELLLPALRADFKIVENYKNEKMYSIDCCISVLAGEKDKIEEYQLEPWLNKFTRNTGIHWIPGNHFFVDTHAEALHSIINDLLRPYTETTEVYDEQVT